MMSLQRKTRSNWSWCWSQDLNILKGFNCASWKAKSSFDLAIYGPGKNIFLQKLTHQQVHFHRAPALKKCQRRSGLGSHMKAMSRPSRPEYKQLFLVNITGRAVSSHRMQLIWILNEPRELLGASILRQVHVLGEQHVSGARGWEALAECIR